MANLAQMAEAATLFIALLLGSGQAQASSTVTGRVVGVSDGDTITILTNTKVRVRVRLGEIDAPESSQAFGARSKQALSGICYGKQAQVTVTDRDRYERLVGRVSCDGVDAQSFMVGSGMAWVYERYAKDRSLYASQEQAKGRRAGLWADPHPVPPWEFRREARR